jgi:hypothetical protein
LVPAAMPDNMTTPPIANKDNTINNKMNPF